MAEWLSYSLSDFLLFAPRAYWRLFELHNAAWWPLPLLTFGTGMALLALGTLRPRQHARWMAAILGLLWLWVAWGFFWRHYATINWAAVYVAPLFALQAALLLVAAWRAPPLARPGSARSLTGLSLVAAAVFLCPVLAPLSGRPWAGAEIFGMAPDPTVIATLGCLLLLPGRWQQILLPIPLLWCIASGITHLALEAMEIWVVAVAAIAATAVLGLARGR